jgi:hypothetical protein
MTLYGHVMPSAVVAFGVIPRLLAAVLTLTAVLIPRFLAAVLTLTAVLIPPFLAAVLTLTAVLIPRFLAAVFTVTAVHCNTLRNFKSVLHIKYFVSVHKVLVVSRPQFVQHCAISCL